jgi:hypothetical protein
MQPSEGIFEVVFKNACHVRTAEHGFVMRLCSSLYLIVFLASVFVIDCSDKASKQATPVLEYERALYIPGAPLSIEDYFRLLPYRAITSAYSVEERENILKSQKIQRKGTGTCVNELEQVDTKTAYLRYSCRSDRKTELVEIAAWKRDGAPDLIGVNESIIATGMSSAVKFYEFRDGNWFEVTTSVFPELTAADFGGEGTASIPVYAQFSQFDRNIIVKPALPLPAGSEKITVAPRTLKWSNQRFVKD